MRKTTTTKPLLVTLSINIQLCFHTNSLSLSSSSTPLNWRFSLLKRLFHCLLYSKTPPKNSKEKFIRYCLGLNFLSLELFLGDIMKWASHIWSEDWIETDFYAILKTKWGFLNWVCECLNWVIFNFWLKLR